MMKAWFVLLLLPLVSVAQETAETFPEDYDFENFRFQMPALPERMRPEPAMATTETVPPLRGGQSFAIDELPRVVSATNTVMPARTLMPRVPTRNQLLRQNTRMLLPVDDTALPVAGLWTQTAGGFAMALLRQLGEEVGPRTDPTALWMQQLLVVVLTAEDAGLPMGMTDTAWRAARARVLLQMGQAREAYKVLQPIDTAALGRDPQLAEVWVKMTLMAGEIERGCGFVRQQVLNANAGFWPQALMVCQALQGEAAPLELSLRLLQDESRAADEGLFALLEASLAGAETVERTGPVTELQAVMLGAYPDFLTLDILQEMPDMMAQRVRDTAQLPLDMRILAAERVVQLAWVGHEGRTNVLGALTQLYDQAEFEVAAVQAPLETAQTLVEEGRGPLARALLWQAAAYGRLPSTRAQALDALWQNLQAAQLTQLPGLLLPNQRGLQPEPALAWFAPAVMRTALQGGDGTVAQQWWAILRNNLNAPTLQQETLAAVRAAMTLDAFDFGAWWGVQQGVLQQAPRHVEQRLAVLEALGVVTPDEAWQSVYLALQLAPDMQTSGTLFSWLRQVAGALQNDNRGMALLMALMPLAQDEVAQVNATELVNVMKILDFLAFTRPQQDLARLVLLAPTVQGVTASSE